MKTFIFKAYIDGEFFYKSACHYYVEKEAISILKNHLAANDGWSGSIEIKKVYNEEHLSRIKGDKSDLLVETLTIIDGQIFII